MWLKAGEAKLRVAVVEALGIMSQILAREKLELVRFFLGEGEGRGRPRGRGARG